MSRLVFGEPYSGPATGSCTYEECAEPAAYVVEWADGPYLSETCVEHGALLRRKYPEYVARIRSS